MTNQKKAFKLQEVVLKDMPQYPELAVNKLLDGVLKLPEVRDYFPTRTPLSKPPSKRFFWGILHTLHPDYAGKLLDGAIKNRNLER